MQLCSSAVLAVGISTALNLVQWVQKRKARHGAGKEAGQGKGGGEGASECGGWEQAEEEGPGAWGRARGQSQANGEHEEPEGTAALGPEADEEGMSPAKGANGLFERVWWRKATTHKCTGPLRRTRTMRGRG